ncbi:uncharacterized protein LOC131162355 isoform X2 [Malania oleifera]|uniref:uncharacterized protein LOC131162355 isoform X2 n=1 Tax=Malania oleifera TaxID=397392 RepID=UPI0025ADD5E1|nr:uncharacterized protein LOC131162355 isoform X2 [Malania oleifera]
MSTTFNALQCCQCSTMQVKQQKKSSNKWTCVVCNQKQSVRKVFAQGFKAKDVRNFVQTFNMSRKFAEEEDRLPMVPLPEPIIGDRFSPDHKKRRSDWTEYLDPQDNIKEQREERGNAFELEIVTEMPKELFTKPKLKNCFTGSDTTKDKEPRKWQSSKGGKSSKWNDYTTQDDCVPDWLARKSQPAMEKRASKWTAYITEDCKGLQLERSDIADHIGEFNQDAFESLLDQRAEDEIHPDFK